MLIRVFSVIIPVFSYFIFTIITLILLPGNPFSEIFFKILPYVLLMAAFGFILSFFTLSNLIIYIYLSILTILSTLFITLPLIQIQINQNKVNRELKTELNKTPDQKYILYILDNTDDVSIFKTYIDQKLIDPNFVFEGVNGKYGLLDKVVDKDIEYLKVLIRNKLDINLLEGSTISVINKMLLSPTYEEKMRLIIDCGLNIDIYKDFNNRNLIDRIDYEMNKQSLDSKNYKYLLSLKEYLSGISSGVIVRKCNLTSE